MHLNLNLFWFEYMGLSCRSVDFWEHQRCWWFSSLETPRSSGTSAPTRTSRTSRPPRTSRPSRSSEAGDVSILQSLVESQTEFDSRSGGCNFHQLPFDPSHPLSQTLSNAEFDTSIGSHLGKRVIDFSPGKSLVIKSASLKPKSPTKISNPKRHLGHRWPLQDPLLLIFNL